MKRRSTWFLLLFALIVSCGNGAGKRPYSGYTVRYGDTTEEPYYLAFHSEEDRIFVTTETRLLIFDPGNLTALMEIETGIAGGRILIDEPAGTIYIADRDHGEILRIDIYLTRREVLSFDDISEITDIEINPFRRHLYISDNSSNSIFVIDLDTERIISSFPSIHGAGEIELNPVDPQTNSFQGEKGEVAKEEDDYLYPYLYISSRDDRYIREFDTTELLLSSDLITFTLSPDILHLYYDFATLVVSFEESKNLSFISLLDWSSESIYLPIDPGRITSARYLNLLFIGEKNEDRVAIVNPKTMGMEEEIPVDGIPFDLMFDEPSRLYFTLQQTQKLGLIEFEFPKNGE